MIVLTHLHHCSRDTEAYLGLQAALRYGDGSHKLLLDGVADATVGGSNGAIANADATIDALGSQVGAAVDADVNEDSTTLDVQVWLRRFEFALSCDTRPDPATCGNPVGKL